MVCVLLHSLFQQTYNVYLLGTGLGTEQTVVGSIMYTALALMNNANLWVKDGHVLINIKLHTKVYAMKRTGYY